MAEDLLDAAIDFVAEIATDVIARIGTGSDNQ